MQRWLNSTCDWNKQVVVKNVLFEDEWTSYVFSKLGLIDNKKTIVCKKTLKSVASTNIQNKKNT